MTTERGIAHCQIRGLVTQNVAAALLDDARGHVEAAGADALIAYYDTAVLGLTTEQLLSRVASTIGEQKSGGLALPAALIVPPPELEVWRSYAILAATRGIVRAVFTDVEQAERWAAEKALVYSALKASER